MVSDDIRSLRKRLSEAEENLRLIEERLSEFVLETDPANLQLVKQKRRLGRQIAGLRARLDEQLRTVRLEVMGQGSEVAVLLQGEDLRSLELAYLDELLERYEHWRDHYTPLAGIAEVRAAVEDGPRLDLPMPFVPREFEMLGEHGYGPRSEVRRERVEDLREAIAKHRRIILLGDPGSGKTTTLWRLAYDYAEAAQEDGRQPLPVFVPLGGYSDDGPFEAYLACHLGPLAPYLETYRASGRLILLLDGLNEMPRTRYEDRVGRIQTILDRYPDEWAVITCRALDYVVKLEGLQEIEVSPLDPLRIRTFLHHYLGEVAGERLAWELVGGGEARELVDTWRQAGGTWLEFWTAEKMPANVFARTTVAQDQLWERLRDEPPPMLSLCSNPYLLLMTAQVYAAGGGVLPGNRARLFTAFVDTLLRREKGRQAEGWIPIQQLQEGLAGLAYAMQETGERGTSVDRGWAREQLRAVVPDCDVERLLYLATSATLLDTSEATVRFYHQLLQEYFAALGLRQRLAAGQDLARYWPTGEWWEPSGWEETFILAAGSEEDASLLLERLVRVHPLVAARCWTEGDARTSESARCGAIESFIARMADDRELPKARVHIGDALALLGDPRPGVGLRPDGLLDIVWCEVPEGPFLMGDDNHRVDLSSFRIAKYPITNAQYMAFVQDGGYTERWRDCWTDEGWRWKRDRVEPQTYGGTFDLPNHPVVGVTWYEAVAFCRWLTERLRPKSAWAAGTIGVADEITLPTEDQWEKAARGTDGRIYPWGKEPDPNRANVRETGIRTTSAVGCFPGGASPYNVLDMSGSVWEWTSSEHEFGRRVLRGGSWHLSLSTACGAARRSFDPYGSYDDYGFRCVSPISLS